MQQHDSKYFAQRPLSESWVGVTRSKFKFLKNLVMLYIKLNGIEDAATLLQIFCPQNPIPLPRGKGQKVNFHLFQNVMLHIKFKGIRYAATW